MKVVAISGWKGSGKDMLAGHLIETYGAVRVSFADPLKDRVSEEYGIPRGDLDDQSKKEMPILSLPVDPRDAFSKMLTEFMRGEFRDQNGKPYGQGNPDSVMYWTPRALAILKGSSNRAVDNKYWVGQAIKKMRDSGKDIIVISDLRYKSELSQLKKAFGEDLISVRIDRFDTSPSVDPSERDLDDGQFDAYIQNKSTKEDAIYNLETVLRIAGAL